MTRKIWPFRRTKLRKRWLFLRTWTSWPVTWQNFEVIDKKPLCLGPAPYRIGEISTMRKETTITRHIIFRELLLLHNSNTIYFIILVVSYDSVCIFLSNIGSKLLYNFHL